MKTEVQIRITVDPCPTCNGEGDVPNPEWEEINQAIHDCRPLNNNDEANALWDRLVFEKWGNRKSLPPDTFPCCDCDGLGKCITHKWVSLEEFKEMLDIDAIETQLFLSEQKNRRNPFEGE